MANKKSKPSDDEEEMKKMRAQREAAQKQALQGHEMQTTLPAVAGAAKDLVFSTDGSTSTDLQAVMKIGRASCRERV